jgi:hypothetical protein
MQVNDYAEADRREVNPPIEVESATRPAGGMLDYWVKERQQWWGRVRGPNGRQKWIKLLIFIRRKRADDRYLSLSLVVRRAST